MYVNEPPFAVGLERLISAAHSSAGFPSNVGRRIFAEWQQAIHGGLATRPVDWTGEEIRKKDLYFLRSNRIPSPI